MSDLFGIGYGSTFSIGDGASPEAFTAVGTVLGITPPSMNKEDVEVTNLQSPTRYREFVLGMKDSGEASFKVRATSANLLAIQTEFAKEVDSNYKIVSNTELNSTWTFAGRFMSVQPGELNVDGTLEVDVTVKVTGASTIAATT